MVARPPRRSPEGPSCCLRFVYGLSERYHMSGENLVKFLLGTLGRVREGTWLARLLTAVVRLKIAGIGLRFVYGLS